jgi:hypothetical protein
LCNFHWFFIYLNFILFLSLCSCRWHGHECYRDRYAKDPQTGDNMDTLMTETLAREESLRAAGYRVITMWECDWKSKVEENEEIQCFVQSLDIVPRLKVRDSFFGLVLFLFLFIYIFYFYFLLFYFYSFKILILFY